MSAKGVDYKTMAINHCEQEKTERLIQSFQDLAVAVITQAWLDAHHWYSGGKGRESRYFLTGQTGEWKESLEMWCSLCNKNPKAVMDSARKEFWNERKIERFRKQGR